jgi:hypothetical protein
MQIQTTEDQKKKILRDGEVYRVPILVMDSQQRAVAASQPGTVGHRPGSLPITDADRAARVARQAAADAKLCDRWKHPPATQVTTAPPPAPTTDVAALYAKRDKALSEAWKGGAA